MFRHCLCFDRTKYPCILSKLARRNSVEEVLIGRKTLCLLFDVRLYQAYENRVFNSYKYVDRALDHVASTNAENCGEVLAS